jgi:hypothetical protein
LLPDIIIEPPQSLEEMEELEQAKAAHQQRMTVAVHHYAMEWARVQPGRVHPQFTVGLLQACPGVTMNAIRSQHRRNIKKMIQKKKATTPIDANTANAAATIDAEDHTANDAAAATIMDHPMLDTTMSSATTSPVVVIPTPPPSSPPRRRTASQSPARKKQRYNGGRKKGEKLSPTTANAITRVCFLYQQAINETYRHRIRMPKGLLDEIIARVRTELDLDDSFTVPNATVSARIRAGNIDGTNRSNAKKKEDTKKKPVVVTTPTTPPSSPPQRGRTASQSPARKKQRRNKGEKLSPHTANAITRVCFLYQQAINETYRNRIRMPKGLLDEIIARVRTELDLDDSFTVPNATVSARIRVGNTDGTNRSNGGDNTNYSSVVATTTNGIIAISRKKETTPQQRWPKKQG